MALSTEPRPLAPGYAVAEQIVPADMAALASRGVRMVIDNRPDAEVGADLQAGAMQAAAEAAGIAFVFNPVTNGALTRDNVEEQADALAGSDGDVLAYCRSGARSAIVWALGQAGRQSTAEILAALERAGYPMPQLGPQIDALAGRDG